MTEWRPMQGIPHLESRPGGFGRSIVRWTRIVCSVGNSNQRRNRMASRRIGRRGRSGLVSGKLQRDGDNHRSLPD